jgi:hypothetical protein
MPFAALGLVLIPVLVVIVGVIDLLTHRRGQGQSGPGADGAYNATWDSGGGDACDGGGD